MITTSERSAGRSVVITGLGVVSPIGVGADEVFSSLGSGRSGLLASEALGRWVRREDGGEGRPVLAAPVGEFVRKGEIDPQRLRRIPRIAQMAIVAARQALGPPAEEGALSRYARERIGVVLGTGLGSFDHTLEFMTGYLSGGPEAASPAMFPTTVMNTAAALLAMELQLTGPNITVNHRDLSAAEGLLIACDQLRLHRADAVVAGGVDDLGPWLMHVLGELGALPAGDEARPMRPYDRRRDGLAPGEGAVMVLMEREEDARARGAKVLARVLGTARGGDARPRLCWGRKGDMLESEGAARCIRDALSRAGRAPADIDYIAGSGNGTWLEALERRALLAALGERALRVPISSILGQTGESMMSPGLRLVGALYALCEQTIPGTIGCEQPDEEAALPSLCLRPRPARVETVLVPTFAQGGGNTAMVLGRPGA